MMMLPVSRLREMCAQRGLKPVATKMGLIQVIRRGMGIEHTHKK